MFFKVDLIRAYRQILVAKKAKTYRRRQLLLLSAFMKYSVKRNLENCVCYVMNVGFLRFRVCSQGIKPLEKKLQLFVTSCDNRQPCMKFHSSSVVRCQSVRRGKAGTSEGDTVEPSTDGAALSLVVDASDFAADGARAACLLSESSSLSTLARRMTFYRPDRPQADRACSATGRGQPLSMRVCATLHKRSSASWTKCREEYSVKRNLENCVCHVMNVGFLRFRVCSQGIKPLEKKLQLFVTSCDNRQPCMKFHSSSVV
ncbi:hypothetical protein T11_7649 [Trichinella zimbabwensis]|uniref:Uncharacterized protein n=1 Tax=Trichinella zimbabwensis TaxID=268475 RepID=A0A0V1HRW0_9BILA|nr:hypothetical protein T11_7649 [Trichinella zimbabwensis]